MVAIAAHRNDIFSAAADITRMPMRVTDPRLPDNPIVFVNRAFLSMSGYAQDEIIGHNCRFLQGPADVSRRRDAEEARGQLTGGISHDFNNLQQVLSEHLDILRLRLEKDQLDEVSTLRSIANTRSAIAKGVKNLTASTLGDGGVITLKTNDVIVRPGDNDAFAGLPPGNDVAISVSDTGTGIATSIVNRVMDPFFATKEEGKGTGLGLSMVHGFAKQSDGTVGIYLEEGLGYRCSSRMVVGKPFNCCRSWTTTNCCRIGRRQELGRGHRFQDHQEAVPSVGHGAPGARRVHGELGLTPSPIFDKAHTEDRIRLTPVRQIRRR